MLSGVIGVALAVAMLLEGTSLDWIRRYVDQILVLVLSLAVIRDPIVFVRNGLRELLMVAPHRDVAGPIVERLNAMKPEIGARDLEIEVIKTGRRVWVFVRLVLDADSLAMSTWKITLAGIRAAVAEIHENSNTEVMLEPA